jgi:hypothetical protein
MLKEVRGATKWKGPGVGYGLPAPDYTWGGKSSQGYPKFIAADWDDESPKRAPHHLSVWRLTGSVTTDFGPHPEYDGESSTHYWAWRGKVYSTTDSELSHQDVEALIGESSNRRRLKLEKAHSLQAMTKQLDERARRQPIPQDVKMFVWQRDSGRCVECGSQQELEYDHIIPLAMGGSNTDRNMQLLCAPCNRRKGATLG